MRRLAQLKNIFKGFSFLCLLCRHFLEIGWKYFGFSIQEDISKLAENPLFFIPYISLGIRFLAVLFIVLQNT